MAKKKTAATATQEAAAAAGRPIMKARLVKEAEAINPLRGQEGQPAKITLAVGTEIENPDAWRLCVIQPGNQQPPAVPVCDLCKKETAAANERFADNLRNMKTVMSSLKARLKTDSNGNLQPTTEAEARFIETAVAYGLHEMQPVTKK